MLDPDFARERAAAAVARAVAYGADAADARVIADASTGVSVRLGRLEDVARSEGVDIDLRVFVGKRSASVSASSTDAATLDALAERAVAMAREAPEDPWAGLAPAIRLMRGDPPLLDLDDGGESSPDVLKARALAAEDAARSVDGVTNSEGGGASARRAVIALATSHGFAAAYAMTSYSLSASVLAGEGSAMQRDYAYHAARHERRLEAPERVGIRAGERAVARMNPVRVASGPMPVVFDPRVGGGLIAALTGAISGPAITRGTSFLQDALGTRVCAKGVTIRDDPHRPHGLGSRPFDGEGLPVSPTLIVDDGMLETWLLDSASARQLAMEPTGHATRGGVSTSNLHMLPGLVPPETLIGEIARGIYVTELIGQGVNPLTGDYSRGAAGFLIENGELTAAVAEITIAGNLKAMLLAMTPANDLEHRYATNVPTLRIDGMTVAGD